jgi:hypothetical protein
VTLQWPGAPVARSAESKKQNPHGCRIITDTRHGIRAVAVGIKMDLADWQAHTNRKIVPFVAAALFDGEWPYGRQDFKPLAAIATNLQTASLLVEATQKARDRKR